MAQLDIEPSADGRLGLRSVLDIDSGPAWKDNLFPRLLMAGAEVSGTDIAEMRAALEQRRAYAEADEEQARLLRMV